MTTARPLSLLLLIVLLSAGCGLLPQPVRRAAIPAAAKATSGTTTVEQTGEARVAASAKAETTTQTVTIPAGSTVTQDAQTGQFRYTLGAAVPLRIETRTEQVTAPGAFEPPAPPSIGEEKAAQADFWTVLAARAGLAVGCAVALFGLVKDWPLLMWGGGAVAAACLFALFVQRHPALLAVVGIGAALAVVGPILWHTKIKPKAAQPPAAP
jgi:hypothetical protein